MSCSSTERVRPRSRGKWAAVVAGALGTLVLAAPAPAQGDTAWFYCSLAKSPYGNPTFYSSIFRADRGIYGRALENSFNRYVSARHDPDAISGSICFGPFDDYQDAADQENDSIASDRRGDRGVVLTRWEYRGN